MRLSATERKAQILATAAKLFAQQGYEGTKTSQIAREAGVNEAIVFRHFTNKEELYWAVLSEISTSNRWSERLKSILSQEQPPEECLCQIARELLERNINNPHYSRLLLFAGLENHKLSHRFFRSYVAGLYDELAAYIRAQARQGVLRSDVDPLLAARGFFGMLIYHFQIQELYGGKKLYEYDVNEVCEAFVKLWMHGMQHPAAALHQGPAEERFATR